jgi:hypothetical protein
MIKIFKESSPSLVADSGKLPNLSHGDNQVFEEMGKSEFGHWRSPSRALENRLPSTRRGTPSLNLSFIKFLTDLEWWRVCMSARVWIA